MSLTKLDTVRRIDPWPCSEQGRKQAFADLQRLLEKAEDGKLPGFSGTPISTTATSGWFHGAGEPYVNTPLGVARIPFHPAKDPNVINGNLILVIRINGILWVWNDVHDAPVGTIRMRTGTSSDIRQGWALMDGSANAAGSGMDMTDRYPKGATTSGAGTGSNSYTPTGSVSISDVSGSVDVTVDTYNYSGSVSVPFDIDLSSLVSDDITLPEHAGHEHYNGAADVDVDSNDPDGTYTLITDDPVGGLLYTSAGYDIGSAGTTANWLTHATVNATFTGSSAFSTSVDVDMTDWDHAHNASGSFTFSSGSASFSGDEAEIDMPHNLVLFEERMDNSDG